MFFEARARVVGIRSNLLLRESLTPRRPGEQRGGRQGLCAHCVLQAHDDVSVLSGDETELSGLPCSSPTPSPSLRHHVPGVLWETWRPESTGCESPFQQHLAVCDSGGAGRHLTGLCFLLLLPADNEPWQCPRFSGGPAPTLTNLGQAT